MPEPIDWRSFMRVVSATDQPLPTSESRWSSGMRTSVKKTSLKPWPPLIWVMGRISTPGEFMLTTK